jgi:hypothetical protein
VLYFSNPHLLQIPINLDKTFPVEVFLSLIYALGIIVTPILGIGFTGFLVSHHFQTLAFLAGIANYLIGLFIWLYFLRQLIQKLKNSDPINYALQIICLATIVFWVQAVAISNSYFISYFPEYWKFNTPQHFFNRHSFILIPLVAILFAFLEKRKRNLIFMNLLIAIQWIMLLSIIYDKLNRFW